MNIVLSTKEVCAVYQRALCLSEEEPRAKQLWMIGSQAEIGEQQRLSTRLGNLSIGLNSYENGINLGKRHWIG